MTYSCKKPLFLLTTVFLVALSLALFADRVDAAAESTEDPSEESLAELLIEKIAENSEWLIPVVIAAVLAVAFGIAICVFYERKKNRLAPEKGNDR